MPVGPITADSPEEAGAAYPPIPSASDLPPPEKSELSVMIVGEIAQIMSLECGK